LTRGVRNVVGRIIGSDDDDEDDDKHKGKREDRIPEQRRRLPDVNRHQTHGRASKPAGARR
jgi:hypothetical protein